MRVGEVGLGGCWHACMGMGMCVVRVCTRWTHVGAPTPSKYRHNHPLVRCDAGASHTTHNHLHTHAHMYAHEHTCTHATTCPPPPCIHVHTTPPPLHMHTQSHLPPLAHTFIHMLLHCSLTPPLPPLLSGW